MIAIVDYGMGNLRSAQKGLEKVGHEAHITDDPALINQADAVVLPGVGAYKDCYEGLRQRGLIPVVQAAAHSGRPFLGICVGLQLLFEESEEGPCHEGLGIFKGRVVRFPNASTTGLKVPHMGWNGLIQTSDRPCPLLSETGPSPYAYFVHSYYAQPEDDTIVLAACEYGVKFPAIVGRDNVFAVQFHPEKSQTDGLSILHAFGKLIQG
ncbi:MAG TPA: imidazole glycerol phosphate synthase subunit HisH [Candidatus Hydrogenedentes bacterium]|nr:imidazole glycerol phosphate synthase subunit HisH [Candidatus Hydrogenedentota bacterium]